MENPTPGMNPMDPADTVARTDWTRIPVLLDDWSAYDFLSVLMLAVQTGGRRTTLRTAGEWDLLGSHPLPGAAPLVALEPRVRRAGMPGDPRHTRLACDGWQRTILWPSHLVTPPAVPMTGNGSAWRGRDARRILESRIRDLAGGDGPAWSDAASLAADLAPRLLPRDPAASGMACTLAGLALTAGPCGGTDPDGVARLQGLATRLDTPGTLDAGSAARRLLIILRRNVYAPAQNGITPWDADGHGPDHPTRPMPWNPGARPATATPRSGKGITVPWRDPGPPLASVSDALERMGMGGGR